MDTNLYERQKDLPLTQVHGATVVGLGGTGHILAVLLALSGCENMYLMDSDRLEEHNFNRMFVPKANNVGRLKTEVTAEYIRLLRPDCFVTCYGRATPFTLTTTDGDWLFDCTDNQPAQLMLSAWAKEHNRRYCRDGYNGTHVTVTGRVPTWKTIDDPHAGYTIIPSWVVPAALAACYGVSKAMYWPDTEVSGDLKEIGRKG